MARKVAYVLTHTEEMGVLAGYTRTLGIFATMDEAQSFAEIHFRNGCSESMRDFFTVEWDTVGTMFADSRINNYSGKYHIEYAPDYRL